MPLQCLPYILNSITCILLILLNSSVWQAATMCACLQALTKLSMLHHCIEMHALQLVSMAVRHLIIRVL